MHPSNQTVSHRNSVLNRQTPDSSMLVSRRFTTWRRSEPASPTRTRTSSVSRFSANLNGEQKKSAHKRGELARNRRFSERSVGRGTIQIRDRQDINLRHQTAFGNDGQLEVTEQSVETSFEEFGAEVDHRERDFWIVRP